MLWEGKDPEAKTTKIFVEEKSKALADLLAEEMKNRRRKNFLLQITRRCWK
jgi:hypothetical protein